jgi:triosephosphate isomerase
MHTEVWITPTTVSIPACISSIKNAPIKVGAQNVCAKVSGAFTGENSATLLKETGCSFAIVGHSERRSLFAESNTDCANRALGALEQGLDVIFCIGETLAERENNLTNQVLTQQLNELFSGLNQSYFKQLVIAYEPVWAIGTGKVASLEQITETHFFINEYVNKSLSSELPILYGGSVNPENFAEIAKIPNVSGALVGGASLKAESFIKLISISEETSLIHLT